MINLDATLKEEIMNGDFRSENEDEYVKMLETDFQNSRKLRIGLLTTYAVLLVISLLIM